MVQVVDLRKSAGTIRDQTKKSRAESLLNLSASTTKLGKVVESMLNYLSQSARSHYSSLSPLVLSTALSAHVVGEDDAVLKPSSSRDIVLKIWHSKDGPVSDKPPARVAIIKTVK